MEARMSQGRETQVTINVLTGLTLAAAIALIVCLLLLRTVFSPVIFILFGVVVVLGLLGVFAHRCRRCGHDVTKDALGVRTHKSWPRVNGACANCGADIP
jgi:membrane protein YdbS with pleckstrin-like domain